MSNMINLFDMDEQQLATRLWELNTPWTIEQICRMNRLELIERCIVFDPNQQMKGNLETMNQQTRP